MDTVAVAPESRVIILILRCRKGSGKEARCWQGSETWNKGVLGSGGGGLVPLCLFLRCRVKGQGVGVRGGGKETDDSCN